MRIHKKNKASRAQRKSKKHPEAPVKWWFQEKEPIAKFTGWLVAWTFLLFLATIISAAILYKTDETLRVTLEVTQRPWVALEVKVGGPFTYDTSNGARAALSVTIRNTGHSPASNVRISPVRYFSNITNFVWNGRCKKPADKETLIGRLDSVLFPGQSHTETLVPPIGEGDVEDPEKIKAEFLPTIVVCVEYNAMVTDENYSTTAFFVLNKIISNNPLLLGGLNPSDVGLPAEKMYLMAIGSLAD
jgi:hypothetical protein